jgi:hypothetical protein
MVQNGEIKLVQSGYYEGYKAELEAALKDALADNKS